MRTLSHTFSGVWQLLIGGAYFRIIGSTADVDVSFFRRGSVSATATAVGVGYYSIPADGFDRVDITSSVNQTVKIAISDAGGGYDAVAVIGTVNSLTINGSVITPEAAPVVVGTSATLLAAANSARRRLIFLNDGTVDVYLGSAAVTAANGALRVGAGEAWIENDAPAAAWYGISASAGQSVRVQGVTL